VGFGARLKLQPSLYQHWVDQADCSLSLISQPR
jgi:hypothetical protein